MKKKTTMNGINVMMLTMQLHKKRVDATNTLNCNNFNSIDSTFDKVESIVSLLNWLKFHLLRKADPSLQALNNSTFQCMSHIAFQTIIERFSHWNFFTSFTFKTMLVEFHHHHFMLLYLYFSISFVGRCSFYFWSTCFHGSN